jgi:hypothetical protein
MVTLVAFLGFAGCSKSDPNSAIKPVEKNAPKVTPAGKDVEKKAPAVF